ncbi:MAG: allophanate hydrolase [Acidimicrobiales bacterium]
MTVSYRTEESRPARSAVARSLAAIAAAERNEVWTSRFPDEALSAEADRIDDAAAAGLELPLLGLTFAVKDNIDVAGLPTTAGCPDFAYLPAAHAPAVRALIDAGAVCMGKTNLDQFATGLVGTRSPYGAVRNAVDPTRISGGSSSGSAVAVALGLVDLALGTDTAGSGRVPAALNGVVGIKATFGLVSTGGTVPACASFDCVSVFAPDVALAERAMAELTGPRGYAPDRRSYPVNTPLGPPHRPVVARPAGTVLDVLDPPRRDRYEAAIAHLAALGCEMVEIDLDPFLQAGLLLYQGAFVAERYAAVGEWIDAHRDRADPTVGAIISSAGALRASQLASDTARLAGLRVAAAGEWERVRATTLLLPTTPIHPTLAEVAADPVGVNTQLGQFTTFLNLLDMCAVSVPFGTSDGLPFGISCIGPAFTDLVQADMAALLERGGDAPGDLHVPGPWHAARAARPAPPGIPLAVVGAHLRGQPLNREITDRGGRLLAATRTAATYRLYALATAPPKPGLRAVSSDGRSVAVEVWELPPSGFADFVAHVPSPLAIGSVQLVDGSRVPGFLCEPEALDGAEDITGHGGWRAYLDSKASGG